MAKAKIQKVVINSCWGGFCISNEAVLWIRRNAPCKHREILFGETYDDGSVAGDDRGSLSEEDMRRIYKDANREHQDHRSCPSLIAVVEALGKKAFGQLAHLEVVKFPSGVKFIIDDYDGMESVHEKHRVWYGSD